MRCMIVDDSSFMRRILVFALKGIGYTDVVEAEDGQEALAKLSPEIGLIITDWNMPVMGGLDLVKSLRSKPETQRLPILMVTTRSGQADILQAVEAGVSSYILRPFAPPVLKEKIDQVLALAN